MNRKHLTQISWTVLITIAWPVAAEIPPIKLTPVSTGELVSPVGIVNAGDGSNRLFVVEQRGQVRTITDGVLQSSPFIDLSDKLVPERANFDERGLLGLAFHPNYGDAGTPGGDKFYVYYSAPQPDGTPDDPISPVDHQSVVAEYSVIDGMAVPSSERILFSFNEPQFNHNAGYLGFGPDNYLYVTTGDGGGAGDNEPGHTGGGIDDPSGGLGNAQDLTSILGKVLRIDPLGNNSTNGQYGIPPDNPFVDQAGVLPEIFAHGLRNPWRSSFDDGPGGTGRFFIADVGQDAVEEINLLEKGGNYGWRIKEGNFGFDPSVAPNPSSELVEPIAEYAHPGADNGLTEIGLSITGGVVHRGSDEALNGTYIFGDWSQGFRNPSGTLLALEETSTGAFELEILDVVGGNPLQEYVLAFGLDELGEVYVATKKTLAPSELGADGIPTGAIYRIDAVPEPDAFAGTLMAAATLLAYSARHRGRRASSGQFETAI